MEYRQFALLNHSSVHVHSEFGQEQVKERKQQILDQRMLVLVLDLDHTLLHSKEMKLEDMKHKHSRDKSYISLIDPLLSIYESKMYNVGFHVKLRPFLA